MAYESLFMEYKTGEKIFWELAFYSKECKLNRSLKSLGVQTAYNVEQIQAIFLCQILTQNED